MNKRKVRDAILVSCTGLLKKSSAHAGTPQRSKCDFSTVAQECSGIIDRKRHPNASSAGSRAEELNTLLPLSLSQPAGVMLMNSRTGMFLRHTLETFAMDRIMYYATYCSG